MIRRELYSALCGCLSRIYVSPEGFYDVIVSGRPVPVGFERAIKHIDLWNHNVDFIEQEENWERPAVFVEFGSIVWQQMDKPLSSRRYRCRGSIVSLHVVTDWQGSSASDSECREDSLKVFDLLHAVRMSVNGLRGVHFCRVEMLSSSTNHNHEDLLENIESFRYDGHIDFDEINKAYKP